MDYRGYMKQKINYVQSSEEQTIVNLIRNVRMEEKLKSLGAQIVKIN